MKRWKKPISVISASLLITGVLFTTSADASQMKKNIEANYQNIKIVNNGSSVTIDPQTEPFIVNGTTFIPLRLMGELYNKNVVWDGTTHTITVTDKEPQISQSVVTSLTTQIAEKNAKISQLQAELDKLKAEQAKKTDVYGLDDLEDKLNDDYYKYYKDLRDVEITLSGDKKKISVRIDVNSKDWNNLSSSKQTTFLQDIVDDIIYKFKEADVTGTIKDASNSKQITTFSIDSKDKVKLNSSSTTTTLGSLEKQLNKDYYDYSGIDDIEITLKGDKNDIDLTIEVNSSDWKSLKDKEKVKFLQYIVDDILDEYKRAYIDGTVKDYSKGSKLDTFYADGDDYGYVKID
ncbi:stalk domain-containing protein [Schinkia azotoformans]|uniref:stalk domain-containing protein n=1 Tax=Schinkia azotoformans TaxID=1454 RepID=UPI002E2173F6|nr:stalk domain-containing protein [Schinkia azotoformans]